MYVPFSGSTYDIGPNNIGIGSNNGTLSTDNRNQVNQAMAFNGTNTKVSWTANSSLQKSLPITVSAWVYLEDSFSNSPIFTSDAASGVYAGTFLSVNAGKLSFGFGNGQGAGTQFRRSAETNALLPSKKWFHVIASVVAGNNIKIYINGIQQAVTYTGTANIGLVYKGGNGHMGYALNYFGGNDLYLKGKIADLGVWNRELTPLERNMVAHLLLWYDFDGNLKDKSTYYNHAADSAQFSYQTDRFKKPNSCIKLYGGASKITLPNNSSYKTDLPLTVSLWAKVDSFAEFQTLFATSDHAVNLYGGLSIELNYNVLNISLGSNGGVGVAHRKSYNTQDTWALGQWYHVVVVARDASPHDSFDIYINGSKLTKGFYSGTSQSFAHTSNPGVIGRLVNPFGPDKTFNGCIDRLQIYDHTMTQTYVNNEFSASIYNVFSPKDTMLNKGKDVKVNCQFVGVGKLNYQWYKLKNGTWMSMNQNSDTLKIVGINETDTGYYKCVASCFNAKDSTQNFYIGLKNNTRLSSFHEIESRVYPNPGEGNLKFNFNIDNYHIKVTNAMGQNVAFKTTQENEIQIDSQHTGLYFISLEKGEKMIYIKYLKNH